MRNLVYARDVEIEGYPPSSIFISKKDWRELKFLSMQLDDEDETAFSENDHPEGYNMILLHPRTKKLFWVYSIDFDFDEVTECIPS